MDGEIERPKAIISRIKRKNGCQKCEFKERLLPIKINHLSGRKCPQCGIYYFRYWDYIKYAELVDVENKNDLPYLEKQCNEIIARRQKQHQQRRARNKKVNQDTEGEYYKILYQQATISPQLSKSVDKYHKKRKKKQERKALEIRDEEGSAIIHCTITSVRHYCPQEIFVVSEKLTDRKNVYTYDSDEGLAICAAVYYGYEIININRYTARIISIKSKSSELIKKIVEQYRLVPKDLQKTKETEEIITETPSEVHICADFEECRKRHHHLMEKRYFFENEYNGNDVELVVTYCKECDYYYIRENVLERCIENNILPKVTLLSKNNNHISGLNQESKLRKLGYTVEQGLIADDNRKKLLKWIIDSKQMKKGDILRMLYYFVNYNGKKPSNYAAKEKWLSDIEYLESLE